MGGGGVQITVNYLKRGIFTYTPSHATFFYLYEILGPQKGEVPYPHDTTP